MMNNRKPVALAALLLLGLVVLVDVAVSQSPNPYTQPPLIAFGSGQEASGVMCSAVPGN